MDKGRSGDRFSSPPRPTFVTNDPTMPSPPPRRLSGPAATPSRTPSYGDRYIPSRSATKFEEGFSYAAADPEASDDQSSDNNKGKMTNLLRSELLGQPMLAAGSNDLDSPDRVKGSDAAASNRKTFPLATNMLRFNSSRQNASVGSASPNRPLGESSRRISVGINSAEALASANQSYKTSRKINRVPYKVLDAPNLQDDYYLNLVDWSCCNVLAVALGASVYSWSPNTTKVVRLFDLGNQDSVTSVTWSPSGSHLAVGTCSGHVLIWDIMAMSQVREMKNHGNRVGTLAWSSVLLASGSRDRTILLQDVRIRGDWRKDDDVGAVKPWQSMATMQNRTVTLSTTAPSAASSSPRLSTPGGREFPEESYHSPPSTPSHRRSHSPSPSKKTPSEKSSGSAMLDESQAASVAELPPSIPSPFPMRDFAATSPISQYFPTDSSSSVASTGMDYSGLFRHQVQVGSIMSQSQGSLRRNTKGSPNRSPFSPSGFSRQQGLSGILASPARNSEYSMASSGNIGSSPPPPSVVSELTAHKQEVCGLRWSFDERFLASGGNDNKLFVWSAAHHATSASASSRNRNVEPLCCFSDHTAAVKAVAWSPHQSGLLASGGGTADRHIRFWNASTGIPLHRIDTGSQVCNLMWSKTANELVSTHGYSLNQVIVWKYPSMQKLATLTGHTMRVLYLAMSPDGQNIVTGAGDETLRFWNVFPEQKSSVGWRIGQSVLIPSGKDIR